MKTFLEAAKSLCSDESGVTSVEYALIAALIFLVVIAAVTSLGSTMKTLYTHIAQCVTNVSLC